MKTIRASNKQNVKDLYYAVLTIHLAANSNSRKNLKKSFEDIDRKLRNLQEELTNQKERSLKDKPTNVGYGAVSHINRPLVVIQI